MLSTYLSSKVDLDSRVDGGDLRVLANHRRIVGPLDVAKVDERIVVQEVIEFLRAEYEARHESARLVELLRVRDRVVANQRKDPVAEHFRVHTEVLVLHERS